MRACPLDEAEQKFERWKGEVRESRRMPLQLALLLRWDYRQPCINTPSLPTLALPRSLSRASWLLALMVEQIRPSYSIALSTLEEMAANNHPYQPSSLATSIDDGGFLPIEDVECSPQNGSTTGHGGASVGPDHIHNSDQAQEHPSRSARTIKAEFRYPLGKKPAEMPKTVASQTGESDPLIGSSQGKVH